jgi:UDP-2,3-diacylglucosamine hydrolase
MTTLFVSDLHLEADRPDIGEQFLKFLQTDAMEADDLYILGDLFEAWVGDDDPNTHYFSIKRAIRKVVDRGIPVYFMHGNRDFMIGEVLAEQCHFKIIDDPHKIKIQGRDCLLMHGDTLCIDDIEYQKFRQMVRNPQWQQQALTKSLEERFQLAKSIREKSQQSTIGKGEVIIDVNQKETDKAFIDNHVDLIIHGHTHRPAIHKKSINGKETTRIVLADWHDTGSYLRVNDGSDFKLQTYR